MPWAAAQEGKGSQKIDAMTTVVEEHSHIENDQDHSAVLPGEAIQTRVDGGFLDHVFTFRSLSHGGFDATLSLDLYLPGAFAALAQADYIHLTGAVRFAGLPSFTAIVFDVSSCMAAGWTRPYKSSFSGNVYTCILEAGGAAISNSFRLGIRLVYRVGEADSGRITFNTLLSAVANGIGTESNVGSGTTTVELENDYVLLGED